MKHQIKKIDLTNLVSLIKRVSTMDTAVYLNIDKDQIWSSVYTPTRDVVKSVAMKLSTVMEFEKPLTETIKLSFYSGQKLLQSLGFFDKNQISAEIETFEEENVVYAEKIILKDNTLKITIFCQDISMGFTSMTPDQIKKVFDESTKMYDFKLSLENLGKIASLQSLDKNEYLTIYADSEGVHAKCDSFDIILDDKYTQPKTSKDSVFFKTHLQKMDKETYDVIVCDQKILYYSTESNTKLATNLVVID
jgi:hypothetical protein